MASSQEDKPEAEGSSLVDRPLALPKSLRYGFALLLVAIATGIRVWLSDFFISQPFVTYFPAILLVAVVAGPGPVLVATIVSDLAALYFFIDPAGYYPGGLIKLVLFTLMGAAVSSLTASMRRAWEAAAASYRRFAQMKFRDAEFRWSLAQSAAQIGIWDWDMLTKAAAFNKQCYELFGWPSGTPVGYGDFLQRVHPNDRLQVEGGLRAALAGDAAYECEFRITRANDGEERWMIAKGEVIFEAERPRRALGVIYDITARKTAEKELRASEERFRQLTQAMPGMTFECDPKGNNTFASERWCTYAGMTLAETAGIGWMKALHPEDFETSARLWADALHSGKPYETRHRLRGVDGTYRWFLVRALPRHSSDSKIVCWIGTCMDIEEMVRAETAMRQAEKEKDQFLAMLAHELRNPLAPIRNAVHVLRRRSPPAPELKTAQDIIDRQVSHLSHLVDDLLDATRIARGLVRLQWERLDLTKIMRQIADDYRGLLNDNGLAFQVEIPSIPFWVNGDPTRLVQVIGNLLHNAKKFTDSGGTVSLSLTRVEEDGREHALLSVRDNGVGIDPSILPRIFETFVQADNSLSRSRGGLGLGLRLVKGLAELHGGSVEVASAGIGLGAEFRIRLPLAADKSPSIHQSADQPHPDGDKPRRVLVIEDNVDIAESMRMLLDAHGHDVGIATSGADGILAAQKSPPQIVICDVGLPGMSGYEVAKRFRACPPLANTYLIALTGYGRDDDRRAAQAAGFDLHLTKPVDLDHLMAIIEDGPARELCS